MKTPEYTTLQKRKLRNVIFGLEDDLQLARMAEIFQCFADPTRLKIINSLLISELCVYELTVVLQMSQPAVSHHLKHLRQLRLVKTRRKGQSILYSLDDDHIRQLFDICIAHLDETDESDHSQYFPGRQP